MRLSVAQSYRVLAWALILSALPCSGCAMAALDVDIQVKLDNRSTIALSVNQNPSNFGQQVNIVATVQAVLGAAVPAPTGTVTFMIDGLPQTPVALAPGGTAAFSTSSLSVGVHNVSAHYSGDTEILASDSPQLAQTVIDPSPPVILSQPSADPATAAAGTPVTFTFPVSGSGITFVWDWGDGSKLTTSASSAVHQFTAPGVYTVSVTATDPAGSSVNASMTFTVVAPGTAPGGLCDGFTPVALTGLKATAKLKFPSTKLSDLLSVSAKIQLPDGFDPNGKILQWNIGGIAGMVTLTSTGSSVTSKTTKAAIRFKKPKKGTTFKAGPGTLAISMKSISLAALQLGGVATLNENSIKTGDQSTLSICVLFNSTTAFTGTASGLYKAKLNKTGSFSGH